MNTLQLFYWILALLKCVETDNWSIHGLWLDYSNGTYPSYCQNIDFNPHIVSDLIPEMKEYWHSCKDNDLTFWNHEWKKHGTCFNVSQYEYFNTTLNIFHNLNKSFDKYCYNSQTECMIKLLI